MKDVETPPDDPGERIRNPDAPAARPERRTLLLALAVLFLRLGTTAFGGPAAHIAMMENEVVRHRRWLSAERFLDMLGAVNLIPGPSSSELAIYIGYELGGWLGLLISGFCFILPATAMTALIAWAYVEFGALPQVGGVLYGIKPVVIAIIVQALWGLAPKAVKKSKGLVVLGGMACLAAALGMDPLLLLLSAGIACAAFRLAMDRWKNGSQGHGFSPAIVLGAAGGVATVSAVSLSTLFLTFLKIGATVFGSGYVLLAFLRADLVDRLHWLTAPQLLDAVAVGQVTPGPVFTTATFIGYILGGGAGAVVATVGIFLPGFLFIAAIRPLVARLRRSNIASAFLDGVIVASLALMGVVTVQLAQTALVDSVTAIVAVVSAALLLRFKANTAWVILGGAAVGALVHFAGLTG